MLSIIDEKVGKWDRENTDLYFGHDYAVSNLKFAKYVHPESELIAQRYKKAKSNFKAWLPNLPGTLAEEYEHNVFYQCHDKSMLDK